MIIIPSVCWLPSDQHQASPKGCVSPKAHWMKRTCSSLGLSSTRLPYPLLLCLLVSPPNLSSRRPKEGLFFAPPRRKEKTKKNRPPLKNEGNTRLEESNPWLENWFTLRVECGRFGSGFGETEFTGLPRRKLERKLICSTVSGQAWFGRSHGVLRWLERGSDIVPMSTLWPTTRRPSSRSSIE